MPKRKATGPAESDGDEEEEFHSFPATPVQSFPRGNSFSLGTGSSSPQRSLGVGSVGNLAASSSSSLGAAPFSFAGGGGGAKRSVPARMPYGGLNHSSAAVGSGSTAIMMETSSSSGGRANSSSGLGSSSSLTGSSSSSGNEELAKSLRDLNNAFHHSVRNVVTKNPSHSLLPLVKDYLFHSRVLLEQFKKGGGQQGGVNGIDLPPKTFKSLGEFFDELEWRYIENNQPREEDGHSTTTQGSVSQDTGSALNSSKFATTTETISTSSRANFNSTFTSSPKSADNTKESTHPEASSIKQNSIQISTLSSEKLGATSGGFFTHTIPSVPNPLKPAASPTASTSGSSSSSLKPSDQVPVSKPPSTTPFTGFSFFTPPVSSASSSTTLSLPKPPPVVQNTDAQNNDEDGDEEDQPPKVEITPVTEDDAVYSKRCKVFGVVDGKPKDKGIGMLYVKKLEDGKHQIVVRADNNLGTVILNILLQKTLPLEKNGKNSIMTVDLTANDKKGMPIFIRVKTEADAQELLDKLKELQQQAS